MRRRSCHQLFDPLFEQKKGAVKGGQDVVVGSGDFSGIGNTPMKFLRMAGKDGAGLSGRFVADRDDQIEGVRSHGIPGFTVRMARVDPMPLQRGDRAGVYVSDRMASCAPGLIASGAKMIDQGFGHDGPAGIAGTDDQNFFRFHGHQLQQPVESCCPAVDLDTDTSAGSQQAVPEGMA